MPTELEVEACADLDDAFAAHLAELKCLVADANAHCLQRTLASLCNETARFRQQLCTSRTVKPTIPDMMPSDDRVADRSAISTSGIWSSESNNDFEVDQSMVALDLRQACVKATTLTSSSHKPQKPRMSNYLTHVGGDDDFDADQKMAVLGLRQDSAKATTLRSSSHKLHKPRSPHYLTRVDGDDDFEVDKSTGALDLQLGRRQVSLDCNEPSTPRYSSEHNVSSVASSSFACNAFCTDEDFPRARAHASRSSAGRDGSSVWRDSTRVTRQHDVVSKRSLTSNIMSLGGLENQILSMFSNCKTVIISRAFDAWRRYWELAMVAAFANDEEDVQHRRFAAFAKWPLDKLKVNDALCVANDNISRPSSIHTFVEQHFLGGARIGDVHQSSWSLLQRLVALPFSTRRMVWDLFGSVLLMYDIIVVPLIAFRLPSFTVLTAISFIATIYWIVDLPSNFFIGYYAEGVVEMRPARIALNYARTWLVLDITLVFFDCLYIVFDLMVSEGLGGRYHRFARVLRGLRVVRLVRVLRLMKFSDPVQMFLDGLQSNYLLLVVRIARSVSIIAIVNHVVACSWYALSRLNEDDPMTWVRKAGIANNMSPTWSEFRWFYTTSLHWAFCQFTPASMEVNPTNWRERVFAIVMVLFGLISFSSFVSTITSSLTEIKNLNVERVRQNRCLTQYFRENKVSVRVGTCIRHWILRNQKRPQHRIHEEDIPSLKGLPKSLHVQLHEEVFAPMLTVHPFFATFMFIDARRFSRLCHYAVSEVMLLAEEELFVRGKSAKYMYFFIAGHVCYHFESTQHTIGGGQWACEIALWAPWVHRGTIVGVESWNGLVQVEAAQFQEVVPSCTLAFRKFVAAYASRYVRHECEWHIEGGGWLTDLCCSYEVIEHIVNDARSG